MTLYSLTVRNCLCSQGSLYQPVSSIILCDRALRCDKIRLHQQNVTDLSTVMAYIYSIFLSAAHYVHISIIIQYRHREREPSLTLT